MTQIAFQFLANLKLFLLPWRNNSLICCPSKFPEIISQQHIHHWVWTQSTCNGDRVVRMIHRAGHQKGNRKHLIQLAFFFLKFYSNVAASQCYATYCLSSMHFSASEQPTRRRASHRFLIVARWDPTLSFHAISASQHLSATLLFLKSSSKFLMVVSSIDRFRRARFQLPPTYGLMCKQSPWVTTSLKWLQSVGPSPGE